MAFSHRDRRVQRFLWRVLGLAGAGSLVLGALALYGPSAAIGVGAVVGLAALGELVLRAGERAVDDYARDLRTSRTPGRSGGFVRAEVGSEVGLERPVGLPTQRSPHSRRGPHRTLGAAMAGPADR